MVTENSCVELDTILVTKITSHMRKDGNPFCAWTEVRGL